MKARHIILGITGLGVGAIAVVNYAFESNKEINLCDHPESFIYSDFVRQVETRFTGKQFFDAESKATEETGNKPTITCTKPKEANSDGTMDYIFSSSPEGKGTVLKLRTGKSKKNGQNLVGIIKIMNSDFEEFNNVYTMKYLDLLPRKMAEMEKK